MNAHPVEERLRDALVAHAETFSASPDAWPRIRDRNSRRSRRRPMWHAPYLIPVAAAATVVAVALSAVALAHGLAGRAGHAIPAGGRGASATSAAPSGPVAARGILDRMESQLLATDPAVSEIVSLKVASGTTTSFWIGTASPLTWWPRIVTGPQLCHVTAGPESGAETCWPLPALSPSHRAVILSADHLFRTSGAFLSGAAGPEVTAVTAVLPDGRHFRGTIGTGRGFGMKAWAVSCPVAKGTKLIFTDSGGRIVARIDGEAPPGPDVLDVKRPTNGGITMFSYRGNGIPSGAVVAYLVDGHAGFWVPAFLGGMFPPAVASGPPVVNGLAAGLSFDSGIKYTLVRAFGYAHQDVARVVVRLPGGGQVAAATVPGWPGSGLRLWSVTIPAGTWPAGAAQPKYVATAYDAAGRVLGHVRLGEAQP